MGLDCFDKEGHQRAIRCAGGLGNLPQERLDAAIVTRGPQLLQRCYLIQPHLLVDAQQFGLHRGRRLILINANHNLLVPLNGALGLVGGILDFTLDKTLFDCAQRATQFIDLLNISGGLPFNLVGQCFDIISAPQRINGVGHPALVGDNLLCAQGDLDRFFGGQGHGFVHTVGM